MCWWIIGDNIGDKCNYGDMGKCIYRSFVVGVYVLLFFFWMCININ